MAEDDIKEHGFLEFYFIFKVQDVINHANFKNFKFWNNIALDYLPGAIFHVRTGIKVHRISEVDGTDVQRSHLYAGAGEWRAAFGDGH